jgi:hypothetical protein
MNQKYERDT